MKSTIAAMFACLVSLTAIQAASADDKPFANVVCEGQYRHHLQGICTDNKEHLFWSFTTTLVKTDTVGKVLKKIDVKNHHGDVCFCDGTLYVAVNFGNFNDPKGNADSWVFVYNAQNLKLLSKHKTPEVVFGAGGIGFRSGQFFVVGGLPDGVKENYVYEYSAKFQFVKKHIISSGHTHLGIQTATFAHGRWWFGCYGSPQILLTTDEKFADVRRHVFDCSLGIVGTTPGTFLVAQGKCDKKTGCTGKALIATVGKEKRLVIRRAGK